MVAGLILCIKFTTVFCNRLTKEMAVAFQAAKEVPHAIPTVTILLQALLTSTVYIQYRWHGSRVQICTLAVMVKYLTWPLKSLHCTIDLFVSLHPPGSQKLWNTLICFLAGWLKVYKPDISVLYCYVVCVCEYFGYNYVCLCI